MLAYAMTSRHQPMSLERTFVGQMSVSNTEHRAVALPWLMDLYEARVIVTILIGLSGVTVY